MAVRLMVDAQVHRMVERYLPWSRLEHAVETVVARTGNRNNYRWSVLSWWKEDSQIDPWSNLILVGTRYSFWALLHELGHLAHFLQEWARPYPRPPWEIPHWECELWAWRWAFRLADELGVVIDRQALEFSVQSHCRCGDFDPLLRRKEFSPEEEELLRWTAQAGIWPIIQRRRKSLRR